MNGSDCLVDTNVLIYLQKGVVGTDALLEGKDVFVSFITEMEMLSYAGLSSEEIKKQNSCWMIVLLLS